MELSPLSKVVQDWGALTLQDIDVNNAVAGERLRGSNRQFVRFYLKKFIEVEATKVRVIEKTGEVKVLESKAREVEKEMVQIITPGDKNEIDAIAQDFHKREHWKAYTAFRNGQGVIIGKLLEECTYVPPSVALELKYRGCHTEEQLADASDLLCGQIGNGYNYREFAKASQKANLDNKSLGQIHILQAELQKTQAELREMQERMGKAPEHNDVTLVSFEDDIDATPVQSLPKKGRGRPKKIVLPTEV